MFSSVDVRLLPFWAAFGAAVAGMVSIGVSHSLLGIALAGLLWQRGDFRAPRVWAPLAVFFLLTVFSLAASPEPAAGWPQLRKFYVFGFLFLVYSFFRTTDRMVALLGAIATAGTLSALWSLVQFAIKYKRAADSGEDFYIAYIAARTTGFMSHWQTFAGEMMFVFLILASSALFAAKGRWRWIALGAAALVGVAVVLNFTRGVWPAIAAGFLYLIWIWRRVFVLALPVAVGVIVLAAPEPVGRRIRSAWQPDPKLDSNLHRDVLRRTGWRMIAAHPVLGVGPEHVKRRFAEFMPEDAPRPIPSNWYYDHLHNTYAHYGAERGIPALIAFLALNGLAIFDLGRAALRTGDGRRRFLLHATVASLIGILVGGWWEVNVGDSEVLGTMAAMIGVGYAARDEDAHA